MSSKRSSPTAIDFMRDVSQSRGFAPFIERHPWSAILMPAAWITILAIAGALMLGAALGFAS